MNLDANGNVQISLVATAATMPISAVSLPLPAGAATAAKQPALGTAGAASADVISIQGVASMTPIKVDGSGVTQPVSVASMPSTPVTGAFFQATQPVSLAALPALVAGAATIGKVDLLGNAGATVDAAINGAASTNALWTMHAPSTAAASAMATPVTTAALTVVNIKTSAGNVYGLSINNASSGVIFLQFYNTAGTPVLGTSVIFSIACPIGVTNIPIGDFAIANFVTGIGIGASTTATSTGTPSVAPSVTVFFK